LPRIEYTRQLFLTYPDSACRRRCKINGGCNFSIYQDLVEKARD
jgi:hypothetical protein